MTRQELIAELQKLAAKKEAAIRAHDEKVLDIQEAQTKTLHLINTRRTAFRQEMEEIRHKAHSTMCKAIQEEHTRFRIETMDIENERQQLFADYKAQCGDTTAADEETNDTNTETA